MLHLYDYLPSGNGYKVRLLLHQIERPFKLTTMPIWDGATRTPEFLEKNPHGRIPTLQLEDGRFLWESNAILCYLAEKTPLLPTDDFARAKVFQWLCFEQYDLEPAIAVIRAQLINVDRDITTWQAQYDACRERGLKALHVLNQHLHNRIFLVNDRYSIADIAVYACVHVASEAHFDMTAYPHILSWEEHVRNQPRHIPITWQP